MRRRIESTSECLSADRQSESSRIAVWGSERWLKSVMEWHCWGVDEDKRRSLKRRGQKVSEVDERSIRGYAELIYSQKSKMMLIYIYIHSFSILTVLHIIKANSLQ